MFPCFKYRCLNAIYAVPLLALLSLPVLADNGFVPYRISITPAENAKELQPHLEKTLDRERDRLHQAGISMNDHKLMRRETGTLAKLLKSEGYYEAHIDAARSGARLDYHIDTGRIYRVARVSVSSTQADIALPAAGQLGLHEDMKLRAVAVLGAQDTLRQFIREHNCLYQVNTGYDVVLHRDTARADVSYQVHPAPQVKIGQVTVQGLESVQEPYVIGKLGLKHGQCYQSRVIEKARLDLLRTGLFTLVNSSVGSPESGEVDIRFDLKESHHRTVKAGAGFSTDEGISLTADWQHRNIFGRAEQLDIEGKASKLFKTIDSTLTYPTFRRPGQALVLEAELATENLEAYNSQGVTLSASLKRKLARYLTGTAGVQYKFKSVQDSAGKHTYGMLSLPLSVGFDSRDNILDPHSGWVASAAVQPYADTLNPDIVFVKTTLGASIYHTFKGMRFAPTLAARSVVGMLNGISTDSVPASERFYGGGGGSVRGYPFQKLGPLEDSNPRGGRSIAEFSLETRLRLSSNWGGVVFMDAGNVYDDPYPRIDKGVRWALGAGARYYTSFAPIRVDIAFPMNRRAGIDDPFQIYISLAQAF